MDTEAKTRWPDIRGLTIVAPERARLMGILKQSRIARDHDVLMNDAVNRLVGIKNGVFYVTHYAFVEGKASHIATFGYKLGGQKLIPESFVSKKRGSI